MVADPAERVHLLSAAGRQGALVTEKRAESQKLIQQHKNLLKAVNTKSLSQTYSVALPWIVVIAHCCYHAGQVSAGRHGLRSNLIFLKIKTTHFYRKNVSKL